MNTHRPFKRIVAASLGAVLLAAGANALADPPARIARLAYINGPVSFAPAGDNNWESASLNRPLIPGDRLWVEAGARDELQVGGAALRMGPNTLATLLNMDDRITQLQLSQGRLNVRVRSLGPNDVFEIDTPNLALTIRKPGDYRIEVDPAGNATMVAVRRGQAEAYGDGNAYRLDGGQAFSFGGTDLRGVQYARPNLDDDLDRWSAARDRRIEQARSARYVSPNLVGYEDLDEQGTWRSVPSYGNVWMPANVGRDWAPYRDGQWAYVQPWGWTWVDDAPWGFAVSHYGRWARFPQGWGWVPGPRAASPVYAPALVAFISIGSGAGAYAQRERPVAWFPLAPREVYRPSYRASPTYITNINVTNTTLNRGQVGREDRRANYANRQVGGAVTAVPAATFVRAQPVSRAALAIPAAALAGAAIAHAAPVAPERDGMRGRGNAGHQPPPAPMARQVLAKNAPPSALRHAPTPDANAAGRERANLPPQLAQAAGPAPRVLPQDRRGAGRQLGQVPSQAQVQGVTPLAHAPTPSQAPAPAGIQAPQREQERNRMPQPPLERAPVPMPPPLANAPAPAPAAAPAPQRGQGRNRTPQPPLERAPAPVPPPLAHAPTPMPAPAAAAAAQPDAAAARGEEMRQARERRDQARREVPQPPSHAAPVAPPPAARHAPPPAPPAPAPRQPEPPRLSHAPVPAPQPAAPPKPEQARAAPAASQAGQRGQGNEGKKDEKRQRDRQEQN